MRSFNSPDWWVSGSNSWREKTIPTWIVPPRVVCVRPASADRNAPACLCPTDPMSPHPAFRFQSMQGGIQRSGLDVKHLLGRLLDVLRECMAVRWSALQRSQNENVERALEEFDSISFVGHCVGI